MTEALASNSGTSASPGVNVLVPLMVAMMLTKQYGDQLSMKTIMAVTVMRTTLAMYSFCRSRKSRFSGVNNSRRSNLQKDDIADN